MVIAMLSRVVSPSLEHVLRAISQLMVVVVPTERLASGLHLVVCVPTSQVKHS